MFQHVFENFENLCFVWDTSEKKSMSRELFEIVENFSRMSRIFFNIPGIPRSLGHLGVARALVQDPCNHP
jgi:hypothetical protein